MSVVSTLQGLIDDQGESDWRALADFHELDDRRRKISGYRRKSHRGTSQIILECLHHVSRWLRSGTWMDRALWYFDGPSMSTDQDWQRHRGISWSDPTVSAQWFARATMRNCEVTRKRHVGFSIHDRNREHWEWIWRNHSKRVSNASMWGNLLKIRYVPWQFHW